MTFSTRTFRSSHSRNNPLINSYFLFEVCTILWKQQDSDLWPLPCKGSALNQLSYASKNAVFISTSDDCQPWELVSFTYTPDFTGGHHRSVHNLYGTDCLPYSLFVENRGLEPLTLTLQMLCSTNWANSPYRVQYLLRLIRNFLKYASFQVPCPLSHLRSEPWPHSTLLSTELLSFKKSGFRRFYPYFILSHIYLKGPVIDNIPVSSFTLF